MHLNNNKYMNMNIHNYIVSRRAALSRCARDALLHAGQRWTVESDAVPFLFAVAAIVVSTILVALVIVVVVPAVVATICYIRKCRRKTLLWDSVYSNDQGAMQ